MSNSIFFLSAVSGFPYLMRPLRMKISRWLILIFSLLLIFFGIRVLELRKRGEVSAPPIFAGFQLAEKISKSTNPSSIFIVKDFPNPPANRRPNFHTGLDTLLSLMAQHGIHFYKSRKQLPWCDSMGLIAKDDVVLIKVNAEWPERGMTNTDVIKGLIARIVAHPDTFIGEVCLVENGQWRFSWAYPKNNAEDTTQTMQSVMDSFANRGYQVSGYNWTAIGYGGNTRWVLEYDQGDTNDGYVREDSSGMTYPKFKTIYGTRISTRKGIWNGRTYDSSRLKFINIPVLKSHTLMGVTASIKHYIGFLCYQAIGSGTMHNRVINDGLLGVEMGKARFPHLNIIDATWVSAEITTGPNAPYALSTRLNTLLASKDPVALDYIAGKMVLRPVSWWSGHPWLNNYGRHDPENLNNENPGSGRNYSDSTPCYGMPYNAFRQYLVSTYHQLIRRGYSVTMDTNQMNIYLFQFQPVGLKEDRRQGLKSPVRLEVSSNPFSSSLTIRVRGNLSPQLNIKIYDGEGRLVKILPLQREGISFFTHWDGTNLSGDKLPRGTYLLLLDYDGGRIEKKIVFSD